MKIILDELGKSTEWILVQESHETGMYIVCCDHHEAHRLSLLAQDMHTNIPFPLTFDEFLLRRYMGKNIKGFLIDNADILLQQLTSIPIYTITISHDE